MARPLWLLAAALLLIAGCSATQDVPEDTSESFDEGYDDEITLADDALDGLTLSELIELYSAASASMANSARINSATLLLMLRDNTCNPPPVYTPPPWSAGWHGYGYGWTARGFRYPWVAPRRWIHPAPVRPVIRHARWR